MASITTRAGKGTPLTNAEVDANFTNINTELGQKLVAASNLSDLGSASTARTNLGVAIGTNVQAWDADLDAIAALAGTSGLLRKTAANTWSLDTSTFLTGNQSISISGDASGSGATSISLTLANSGVTAGTYTKVTVDAKGRVTVGASLASSDVTTALGFTPYNATNPNGYITSSSLSSYLPLTGGTISTTNSTGSLTISDTGTSGANFKLTGNGATTPSKTIRSFSGNFSIVNNAYSAEIFTLSDAGVITNSTWNGAAIAAAYGGTGQTTYAVGDLLYASGSTALTKLAGNTTAAKQFLTQTGTGTASQAPAWAALSSSDVTTALGFTPYNSTNPNGYTNNTGTVTSVALSLPAIFSVSGSPVTTSGTLTASLASQTANTVFAAPNGSAGAPTFRALASTDLPTYTGTLTSSQVTTALGFTPYNSTNPNGYITSSSLSSYLPLAGGTLSGSVTYSPGTANGVAYLNGSKVLTTGSALTYNGSTLSLNSTVAGLSIQTALNTNQATITLADADGRTAVFRSPNSGTPNCAQIGTTTNHDTAFLYGGSEQARLTSTGLGIGTSSPNSKLQVQGLIRTSSAASGVQIDRRDTSVSAYTLYSSAGNLQFYNGTSDVMVLDTAGNLGLGVTPSAGVTHIDVTGGGSYYGLGNGAQVAANAYFDGSTWRYRATAPAARSDFSNGNSGGIAWFTAPSGTAGNAISFTQAMTLTAEGNWGLGTTSPVNFGAGFIYQTTDGTNGSGALYRRAGVSVGLLDASSANFSVLGQGASGNLILGTNNTERARITSGGNLLVGTSTATGARLDLQATTAGVFEALNASNLSADTAAISRIIIGSAAGNWSLSNVRNGGAFTFTAPSGTESARITSGGNFGLNTNAPAARLDVNGNQACNIVTPGALDIDCSAGNFFTKTINGASTFTFSNPPSSRAFAFTLELVHTSGTVTWPAAVVWPGGTAPTLTTGKTHLFTFVTDNNGTTWRGASQINYNS